MRKTLPIAEALELLKDQPDMVAQLQDIAMDKDMVEVEVDDENMQILTILKDSPTVDSSHVLSTNWGTKPRITTFSSISKAVLEEERYTFSPWYIPDSLDAHDEWTDAKEVQQAFWKYLAQENRDIRLQHNTDIVAGKWVEGATWAWEVTLPVKHPEGDTEYTFPAGTPFLGIVWEPWAWDLIKSGEIRGLSIGGTAQRAEADLEKGDYDPSGSVSFAKFVVPTDFIDSMNLAKHATYATEPTREGLASELFDVIADVVTFRFMAQGFHWNVKGINFQQFHDLFEEIYQDADDSIDPMGESIRKLNYDAPVSHRDYMGKLAQMEIPETNDPEVMSQLLYVANEQVRACLTKAFAIAACIDEQGIANFLADRLDRHAKWQWQLRSVVGDAFADAYEVDVSELGGMLSTGLDAHMNAKPTETY